MENEEKKAIDSKLIMGVLAILAGVAILVAELMFNVDVRFRDFWPIILLILGIGQLAQRKPEYFGGLVLTGLGTFFLLRNLEIITISLSQLWPGLFIIVGIVIINGYWQRGRKGSDGTSRSTGDSENDINLSILLGGGEYKYTTQSFNGGSVNTILGGCNLNLREAEIKGDSAVIDVFTTMGGMEIVVPPHWQVAMEISPILGGTENKTSTTGTAKKRLIIRGTIIMGGIEVHN